MFDHSYQGDWGQPVFPSVQSVRLLPRTGPTPDLLPLDETDTKLKSVLTHARDGWPGPTDVSVEQLFLNTRAGSVLEYFVGITCAESDMADEWLSY